MLERDWSAFGIIQSRLLLCGFCSVHRVIWSLEDEDNYPAAASPAVLGEHEDEHCQSRGRNRSTHLRYLAIFAIDCCLPTILDRHVGYSSGLAVSVLGDSLSFRQFLRLHGRSEQRDGIRPVIHQIRDLVGQ